VSETGAHHRTRGDGCSVRGPRRAGIAGERLLDSRGFTILEMAVVVAITAILAISAIPALDALSGARQGAAAEEIERRVVAARARALAEGVPYGVEFDLAAQTLRTVTIPTYGSTPRGARDALGQEEVPWSLARAFPGVRMTSVSIDGVGGSGTVWFAFDGTPQRRASDGRLLGAWRRDSLIGVEGGQVVTIRAGSGAVTR
jgi:prepilin-type N-terminal cleavage/methylation domain-containing protein